MREMLRLRASCSRDFSACAHHKRHDVAPAPAAGSCTGGHRRRARAARAPAAADAVDRSPPAPVAAPQTPPPIIDPTLDQPRHLRERPPDQARRVYLGARSSQRLAADHCGRRRAYRIGAFADAVEAFRNLGTFNRGEEDLATTTPSRCRDRPYDDAKKELACALPYVQITSDVARYRDKIQKMGSPQR